MSTIRDVAALAQVSTATVSRVINHDTRYKMTDRTIERVWKAIAELNYKAPAASRTQAPMQAPALSPDTSLRIGCILNVRGGKYNDPYYMSILSSFEKTITDHGYEVSFIRGNDELLNNPQILYNTFSEKVDGLVIMNTLSDKLYDYIRKQTPNIVGIDTLHNDIDNIDYDHYEASYIAMEHLYSKGYRKIGFIGGSRDDIKSSRRYRGYFAALHSLGLTYNPDWVFGTDWDDEYCEQQIKERFSGTELPEAFFAGSDIMAMAALRAFYGMGIRVPEDLAVMGLSNIEMSRYSTPPLSTIDFPVAEMGKAAAIALMGRINGDDTAPKRILLGGSLIVRAST